MVNDDMGVEDLGEAGLRTGIPTKNISELLLINILTAISRFDYVIQTLTGVSDPRPYLQARSIIIKIPSEEIRLRILVAFDEEIKKIRQMKLSNDEKGELTIIHAQNAVGAVITYCDGAFGLEQTIVIPKV